MNKQNGFTLIELLMTVMCAGIIVSIALCSMKKDDDIKSSNTNYSDYTSQCIKGEKFMVTKNGDMRQLLNENHEPLVCEDTEENSNKEMNTPQVNNIAVDANPYKNQE